MQGREKQSRAGSPACVASSVAQTGRGGSAQVCAKFDENSLAMAEKYEKISKVGEGSFGVVWKVRHKDTGGVFAIKKIRMQSRDHGVSMAAIDEINALQELRHKHVVTLHEVYAKNGGNIFLVFDFLDVDLEQIISAKDPARCAYLCGPTIGLVVDGDGLRAGDPARCVSAWTARMHAACMRERKRQQLTHAAAPRQRAVRGAGP